MRYGLIGAMALTALFGGIRDSYGGQSVTNINPISLQCTNKMVAGNMTLQVKIPNTQSGVNYSFQTSRDLSTWTTANTVPGQDGTTIIAYIPANGTNNNVRVSAALAGQQQETLTANSYCPPKSLCGCLLEDRSGCFTIDREPNQK